MFYPAFSIYFFLFLFLFFFFFFFFFFFVCFFWGVFFFLGGGEGIEINKQIFVGKRPLGCKRPIRGRFSKDLILSPTRLDHSSSRGGGGGGMLCTTTDWNSLDSLDGDLARDVVTHGVLLDV